MKFGPVVHGKGALNDLPCAFKIAHPPGVQGAKVEQRGVLHRIGEPVPGFFSLVVFLLMKKDLTEVVGKNRILRIESYPLFEILLRISYLAALLRRDAGGEVSIG